MKIRLLPCVGTRGRCLRLFRRPAIDPHGLERLGDDDAHLDIYEESEEMSCMYEQEGLTVSVGKREAKRREGEGESERVGEAD